MTVIRSLIGSRSAQSPENPAVPLTSETLLRVLAGNPTFSGVTVSEETALNFSAAYRATALITGSVAGIPLHAHRKSSNELVSSALLEDPHPDLTDFELWELIMVHLLWNGNGYLRKYRNGLEQIAELWPIHPARVAPRVEEPTSDNPGGKRFEIRQKSGETKDLSPKEILHIPGMGFNGIQGLGIITLARQSLGTALASEQYAGSFFGSGAMMGGILETDKDIKDEAVADRLKKRFMDKVGGLNKAHEVAVLSSGLKFHEITVKPRDAEFLASRKFSVTEMARWFGLPPWMLADVEKSTSWGSGIEQQGIAYVVYSLRPWLKRIERRVTRELLPRTQYAKFVVEGLLRGDTKSRYEAYSKGIQGGWINPNEVRDKEDLPPYEGGDTFVRPANMMPIVPDDEDPTSLGEPPDEPPEDDPEE